MIAVAISTQTIALRFAFVHQLLFHRICAIMAPKQMTLDDMFGANVVHVVMPKAKARPRRARRVPVQTQPKRLTVLRRFGWSTARYLRAGDSGCRVGRWLSTQSLAQRQFWMEILLHAPPNFVADVVDEYQVHMHIKRQAAARLGVSIQ